MYQREPMLVRGILNDVFVVAWTTGLASIAVGKHALTGDPSLVHSWTGLWARGFVRACGIKVHAFGTEKIDPTKTYIFMSNHQSQVDIASIFVALPVQPGFVAKQELRRMPFFGKAMEVGGHVFVDRRKHDRAVEAIAEAAMRVREGRSVVIFPEGTRSRPGIVGPLKKGGFHLAKQAGVPIVPIGIRGSANVMAKDDLLIRGGTVEVHVGDAIAPQEIERLALPDLMSRVRDAICVLSDMPAE